MRPHIDNVRNFPYDSEPWDCHVTKKCCRYGSRSGDFVHNNVI